MTKSGGQLFALASSTPNSGGDSSPSPTVIYASDVTMTLIRNVGVSVLLPLVR